MKWLIPVLSLTLVVAFMGCGNQKKATPQDTINRAGAGGRGVTPTAATTQTGPNAPVPGTPAQASPNIWGQIVPQGGSITINGQAQSLIDNDVTRAFLLTNIEPNKVGATTQNPDPDYNLPCNPGQTCVVGFTLGSDNGTSHFPMGLDQNLTINQAINGTSPVRIMTGGITMGFWDSLTGSTSTDPDHHILTPIPVYIPVDSNNSTVTGHNVVARFTDTLGTVMLQGTISTSGQLTGTISFSNLNDFSGSGTTTSGNLGNIPSFNVCSGFRCQ